MPKQSTERADPLAAVGLQPKPATRSSEPQAPEVVVQMPVPSMVSRQASRELKAEEERATEKVTAYFTPPQYDRIEELRRQHRKRTGKRLSVNELLRRLVEHANLEDILS
ncbi:MAG: hypothetical protein ACRDHW_00320 [Ktedonobacteraceae bacterium]